MKLGTAQVIRANSRHLPLADNSVDLVVTSPPYFALRSYQDGGEHYAGQIGDEPTPAEFVDSLLEVTRECVRVLKPSGSLWVNLGDKYAGSGPGSAKTNAPNFARHFKGGRTNNAGYRAADLTGLRTKSLIGIPWRYALRCIDDLGLILRAEVIWSKPNGLPESVTDRVRRSHETWFHFTLQPRYFSAVDEIREPHAPASLARYKSPFSADSTNAGTERLSTNTDYSGTINANPLGKLPGSVWTDAEPGDSLVRSVLSAVAADALTIDEGERLLWTTPNPSSPAAGNGAAVAHPTATGRSTSQDRASDSRTASPTSSMSDPSLTDSRSTTSAATEAASTPNTLSQSPSQRTSGEHTPSGTYAVADTPSRTPTQSAPGTGASPSGAGSATRTGRSDADASVWVVPTEPLRVPAELGVDHFAAFPTSFPKRIIAGWSPAGVCVDCGEGRRPVSVTEAVPTQSVHNGYNRRQSSAVGGGRIDSMPKRGETIITGYACACPQPTEPTTPAVVLDPFGGTGTTAMVAKALGRHGITVDMSADYCRLAEWRINDRNQLAKVLGVEKTDAPDADQLDLFGGDAA